jgi:uncharacterized membrane protein SpoIIM required for sporulation
LHIDLNNMKESKFIDQNKKNWQEFETDLRYKQNKATRLSRLFIQITDDLSYSRTFYKYRSVRVYLNGIAQVLFNDLYKSQKGNLRNFVKFWKTDLPLYVYETRREFFISFLVFIVSFVIGVISSIYDQDFARLILGNGYVDMTIENIKNNDPLAVYKKGNEADMFMGITINNLTVSLSTFVLGFVLSIGTIGGLIYNGIMIGAFQYFFIERGLFKESFLTIWQHGTLEISGIIIAGAAGITLGKGLIFPGTYGRLESLKISAIKGLKVFLGIVPIIIMAAFIEGFFTRHTDTNDYVRIAVILLSLLFILFYFVWYPRHLYHRQSKVSYSNVRLNYKDPGKFDFSKILSAAEILGYSFKFVRKSFAWVMISIAGISLFHAILTVVTEAKLNSLSTYITSAMQIHSFFKLNSLHFHFIAGIFTLGFLQYLIQIKTEKLLNSQMSASEKIQFWKKAKLIISSVVSSFIILLPFCLGLFWGFLSVVLIGPLVLFMVTEGWKENKIFIFVISATFRLLAGSWGKFYWNSIKVFILVVVFYLLLNTPLGWRYIESIYMNFNYSSDVMYLIQMFMFSFIILFLFAFFFIFQISNSIFSYYAFKETIFAEQLKSRIEKFGERNVMFGFEKEHKI